jgi:hypothetical protein
VILLCAIAAAAAPPQGIRVEVSEGVFVDWTRLVVSVDTVARRQGTEGTRAVEELARRAVDAGIQLGARRIQVDHADTVSELLDGPLADSMHARMGGWTVTETVYFESGRVGIHAELSLQDLLKPWTVARGLTSSDRSVATEWTGILIDARGLDVAPAWAPRLLDSAGNVVSDGVLWDDAAVNRSPAVYVDDPAHSATTRVGAVPLLLRARDAVGCDLVLAPEDVARFRSELHDTRLPGDGRVVVVIDP